MTLRIFAAAVCLALAAVGCASARVPDPPAEIASIPVAYLVDLGSGRILHERQPDLSFVPASMTKVMTAYVAFEEMAAGRLSIDRRFVIAPETAELWNGRGTSMYLVSSDRPTTHELLRGIMTASANDASVVLAQGYAGNVPAWSFLMNDTAKRLGMTKSKFSNPNGWPDEGQTYVSARDLATLAQAMLSNFPEYYAVYSGKKQFVWNGRTLTSHDPATGIVPGADGIKTGFTREAGYNFLGSAERDGRRLVMVVGGARSSAQREMAARAYLEWGFDAWATRHLFDEGARVGNARVQGGDKRSVPLVTAQPVYATVPADGGAEISLRAVYEGPIAAPIEKGSVVATLEIDTGDGAKSRVPLYAASPVGKAGAIDRLINGLMNLFS